MTTYQTEEEQIETLKRIGDKLAIPLIVALVVTVVLFFGYRTWQDNQRQYAEQSSAMFQMLLLKTAINPASEEVTSISAALRDGYPKSPYAILAALIDAKNQVDKQELAQARDTLQWALAHNKDTELQAITTIRLARVMAALNEIEPALQLLETIGQAEFAARVAEVQGDLLVLQKKPVEAKQAYAKALATYNKEDAKRLVEMKLQNLPELGGTS